VVKRPPRYHASGEFDGVVPLELGDAVRERSLAMIHSHASNGDTPPSSSFPYHSIVVSSPSRSEYFGFQPKLARAFAVSENMRQISFCRSGNAQRKVTPH